MLGWHVSSLWTNLLLSLNNLKYWIEFRIKITVEFAHETCCVFFRFGWLLSPAVQHHALPVLQSWRPMLLRQQKWQVLLVVNDSSSSHDARRGGRHQTIHQPLLGLWGSLSCHCHPQPGHHNPTVSCGLAQPVDRLLLPHGGFWSGLIDPQS